MRREREEFNTILAKFTEQEKKRQISYHVYTNKDKTEKNQQ